MQLADPQFGMFRALSRRSPERRSATFERFRRVNLVGDTDPVVPEGITDTSPEAARLDEAIGQANRRKPAFVVICGDIVNNIDQDDQAHAFNVSIGRLDPRIPLYCVPGNHDLSTDFQTPTADGLSAYRTFFGPDYYSFEAQDTLFLALNSETLYLVERVPAETDRQLAFVADTLASVRAKTVRQIVVLMHRPLFVREPTPEQRQAWPQTGRLAALEMLEAQPLTVTVFSGHLHQNRYVSSSRVEQVISGPVGFPLRGKSGFRTVSVSAAGIEHHYQTLAAS